MMTKIDGDGRRKLGQLGEDAAVKFIVSQGYRILARNWRCPLGEIDVIALDGDQTVFIEVRTKSSKRFGSGAESVDSRKQHKLRRLAQAYIREQHLPQDMSFRFDV